MRPCSPCDNMACKCNPCETTAEVSASNETLPSALENFIESFFGEVTKTVVDGKVVWVLPCDLDVGLENNPRLPGEGLACYFKRLFEEGIIGLTGPQGPPGASGTNGKGGFTTLAAQFNTPDNEGDPGLFTAADGTIIPVGTVLFVEGSGWYEVLDVNGNDVSVVLLQFATGAVDPVPAGGLVLFAGPAGEAVTGPQGPQGIQGIQGVQGPAGNDGADGVSAFTTTTANFTQPDAGNTVVVSVADSSSFAIGQNVFVQTGGHYVITNKGAGSLTLRNDGAPGNAVPTSTILNGSQVSPAGATGLTGETGVNSFTFTTANFTQPNVGNTVVVSVGNAEWAVVGQNIFIEGGGYYEVTNVGSGSLTVENLGSVGNASPTATVNTGGKVSPAGPEMAPVVLSGMIMLWSGTIATIPSGWVLCDGANGTPDLTDKFVVGAVQDDAGEAKSNVTGALTVSGGAHPHTHDFTTAGHDHVNSTVEVQAGTGTVVLDDVDPAADTGTTDNVADVPVPYYALAFIMKT